MSLLPLLQTLQQPQVRDLAWVAYAPNLLSAPASKLVAADWFVRRLPELPQHLQYWDQHPQALLQHLAQHKSHFLGPYFEQLVLFLLQHMPGIEILAERLQVCEQGRTLGEFDLLFRDGVDGQVYHWELALKYYLGFAGADAQSLWWGPNANDRLDRKAAKLFDEQLRLGESQQMFLRQHGVNTPLVAQALVKGCLFQSQQALALPDYAQAAPQARWCRVDALNEFLGCCPAWVRLEKQEWLAPLSSEVLVRRQQQANLLRTELDTHFANGGKAVMLAGVTPLSDHMAESLRLMVVAHSWPQTNQKKDKS